jgi:hypothetical protein
MLRTLDDAGIELESIEGSLDRARGRRADLDCRGGMGPMKSAR